MKNLYVVMGGLGKNLLWTSLIPSLCNKDKVDKISVMTPWPFLFKTNEQIENVEPIVGWKYESRLTKYDNIIYHEPYFSNYLKSEKMHILDDWATGYNIEPVIPNPHINIKQPYKYELSEPLTKSYCVVQFNGGALQGGENKINPRDYRLDLVQKLISRIQRQMDLEVVCFRYDKEPRPSDTITFTANEENTLGIVSVIDKAEFVICIDSALMHFAATTNKGKKTIVLWNKTQTSFERIGYNFQTNITDDSDLCIGLDPQIILDKIK
jgi:ADP-heptose:LPS heptosyltransferase